MLIFGLVLRPRRRDIDEDLLPRDFDSCYTARRECVSHRLEFFENNFTLVSLGCSLSADPNMTDLLQREHHKFLT